LPFSSVNSSIGRFAEAKSARIYKKHPVTVSQSAVYRGTNELLKKKRSEKLFPFSIRVENIYKLFFSGGNNYRPQTHVSLPKRSPSQAVISASEMVIWVMFRVPWPESSSREYMVSPLLEIPQEWGCVGVIGDGKI
jgi:hypothetical protein